MLMRPEDEATAGQTLSAGALDAALPPIDWSAHPPGTVRDRVAVPSGELARISLGPHDGERVVLVPGVTGSKEDFILMMPLLAAAGYRVEAFDMAGQYESAAAGPERLDPPGRRYTLELFANDLRAVLTSSNPSSDSSSRPDGRPDGGPDGRPDGKSSSRPDDKSSSRPDDKSGSRPDGGPAHVLGYSFAGTVAAAVAAADPSLFRSLTLLSAPPIVGQALRRFKKIGPLSDAVPGRVLGHPFVAALRYNVHGAPADRAVFVRTRLDHTRTSSVGDILSLMKRTPDYSAELRASGLPMLVAAGTGDVWHHTAHRAFAERLGARVLILPTGHSPCETAPHQLTEAMLQMMRL